MKKDKNIKSYTAAELKAKRGESRTDLSRVDAIPDEALERLVAEDEDGAACRPTGLRRNWSLPQAKQSVHLRLDQERSSPFSNQRAKGTSPGCKRFSRLMWTPIDRTPNESLKTLYFLGGSPPAYGRPDRSRLPCSISATTLRAASTGSAANRMGRPTTI